jgi:hypothetical protein
MENIEVIKRILTPFTEEILPQGGIDMEKSQWQKPGRGYGGVFPYHPDVRYVAAEVKLLYEVSRLTGERRYHELADRQVRFIAGFAAEMLKNSFPPFASSLIYLRLSPCVNTTEPAPSPKSTQVALSLKSTNFESLSADTIRMFLYFPEEIKLSATLKA